MQTQINKIQRKKQLVRRSYLKKKQEGERKGRTSAIPRNRGRKLTSRNASKNSFETGIENKTSAGKKTKRNAVLKRRRLRH